MNAPRPITLSAIVAAGAIFALSAPVFASAGLPGLDEGHEIFATEDAPATAALDLSETVVVDEAPAGLELADVPNAVELPNAPKATDTADAVEVLDEAPAEAVTAIVTDQAPAADTNG